MRAAFVPLVLAAYLVSGVAPAAAHAGDDIEPVIEVAPRAGRTLLEDSKGGYGGPSTGYGYGASHGRRRLIADGGYGSYGPGGGGYGAAPRRLIEVEPEVAEEEQAAAAPAEQERRAQQQEAAAAAAQEKRPAPGPQPARAEQQEQQQQRPAAAAPAAAPAEPAAPRGAPDSSLLSAPAGQCYCRYNPDYNTWALGEEPCKAALLTKCAAGQLPCAWLDAYYGHAAGGGMAHTLPHEQELLGFVFDDCQPAPPCACAGVKFDGRDPVTSSYACCHDLRASCRTPFGGLACSDVESFCRDDAPSTRLLHWAQHKLSHGAGCGGYKGLPYEFVTLDDVIAANKAAAAGAAAGDARDSAAAALLAVAEAAGGGAAEAGGRERGQGRAASAVVALGGVLVGVALLGMIATLRGGAPDGPVVGGTAAPDERAAPLLHPVPELAVREEPPRRSGGGVRHVLSANYVLSSAPPSRAGSGASIAAAGQQQQQ